MRLLDDRNVRILLSIVIATGLWYYVTASQNPEIERALTVDLHLRTLPADYVVTDAPPRVSVRLRGPRTVVDGVSPGDVDAFVDLSRPRPGPQTLPVAVRAPAGLRVVEVTPDEARVVVDLEARRQVRVEVEVSGTLPPNVSLGVAEAVPPNVTIRGPRTVVQAARRAVVVVDAAAVEHPTSIRAPVEIRDAAGNALARLEVEPAVVRVTLPVRTQTLTRVVSVVPLLAGVPDPGFAVTAVAVSPQVVEVTGPPSVVAGLASVRTAAVSLRGARETVSRVVALSLPVGLESATRSVRVTVTVAAAQTERVLNGVAIRVRNLGDGLAATVTPATLSVTVRGAAPAVASLGPSDLVAVVDAAGLGAGTYAVRVSVAAPAGVLVRAAEPQPVTLTVTRRSGAGARAA